MKIKTTIEITSEESKDINTHLSVIREQIRYHLKNSEMPIEFEDEHLYGSHKVTIEEV